MKRLSFLVFVLIMGLSLSACGQRNSADDGGEAVDTAAESAEARPTATPVVLATPTPKPPPPTPTPRPSPTPTEEPAETPAEVEAVPMIDVEMILIPAGEFTLGTNEGSPEDGPAQTVNLPAYEIDRFEVTNDDFAKFVQATGYVTDAENTGGQTWLKYAEGRGNHPVVKVTWNDAVAFCEWAGKRLPTEQEWEKAARGPEGWNYPWGNTFDGTKANVKETGLRGTAAVGSFPDGASAYGVEDMAGNVWEWTTSWFQPYPGNAVANQYFGERFRVTRGGAWFEEAPQVASHNRNAAAPDITANDDVGFRCVRDIQ
jgi:formylglycine-generating enzyme required for sulfatase activity